MNDKSPTSKENRNGQYDIYGFLIRECSNNNAEIYRSNTAAKRNCCTKRQEETLKKAVEDWEENQVKVSKTVALAIKRGLPNHMRGLIWRKLLETETLKAWTTFDYQTELNDIREQMVDLGISEYGCSGDSVNHLCEMEQHEAYSIKYGQVSLDAIRHIMLDLERTFPMHRKFSSNSEEAREGRAGLFRVLAVYAKFNGKVEYCQGMSSIAGSLLMYNSEEDAFWCLLSLLERHKYLVGYFDNSMNRLHRHAEVFDRLVRKRFPRLFSHLRYLGVDTLMYLTPWFMCIFTSWPCWDTVLTIWDLLILEGHKAMFRVGLTVLEMLQDDLLEAEEISAVLPKLLHFDACHCEFEVFIPRLWTVSVEDWEINSVLAMIEEEDRYPKKRTHDILDEPESTITSSPKRRRKGNTSSPRMEVPGLIKKFTSIFNTKMLHTSPDVPSVKTTPIRAKQSGQATSKSALRRSMRKRNVRIQRLSESKQHSGTLLSDQDVESNGKETDSFRKNSDLHNSLEPCITHPLACLLADSPHKVVSPSIIKHLRRGADSPLVRRVLLKNHAMTVSPATQKNTISPSQNLPRRITRSAKKCLTAEDYEGSSSSDNEGKIKKKQWPGRARRLDVPDACATKCAASDDVDEVKGDKENVLSSPPLEDASSQQHGASTDEDTNEVSGRAKRNRSGPVFKLCPYDSFTPVQDSPNTQKRYATETLMDGRAATRLSKLEERLALQEFTHPKPLRPSQQMKGSPSGLLSTPEVELQAIGNGSRLTLADISPDTPEKELQSLMDMTNRLMRGSLLRMDLS